MSYFKVNKNCNGCLACVQNCPANALMNVDEGDMRKIMHNFTTCAKCGHCWRVCPQEAIEFDKLLSSEWYEVTNLNLVHCEVCNEVLYTKNFNEKAEEVSNAGVRNLCPEHRKSLSVNMYKHLKSTKYKPNGWKNDSR